MRRYICILCVALSALLLCTSCLKSDDDSSVTYYNDTSIASISLTTVNRYVQTTSSTGADSIYKTTVSSSALPKLVIDHYGRKIYNTDSLATDCDLQHVLVTITTTNSGVVAIKSLTSDSLFAYSSTDSIDFRQPREIRVYAQDGSAYRAYEVTLNKHAGVSGKLVWTDATAIDYAADDNTATLQALAEQAGLTFVGAGTITAYGYSADGVLMKSSNQGITWEPDSLDDVATELPTTDFAFVSFPYEWGVNTDYQLLVGPVDDSRVACCVWRKIDDYDTDYPMDSKWSYMPIEEYNRYYLPNAGPLVLAYYKGHLLAFNGDGLVYESRDKGITWKTSESWALPADCQSASVEVKVSDGYLWLREKESGRVWRGYYIDK